MHICCACAKRQLGGDVGVAEGRAGAWSAQGYEHEGTKEDHFQVLQSILQVRAIKLVPEY